jgi:Tfp pilus assembly protein PilF
MQAPRIVVTTIVAAMLMAVTAGCSVDDGAPAAKPTSSSSAKTSPTDKQVSQLIEAGIAQGQKGDLAAAKVTFNNALTIDPGNKFALFNLGLVAQSEQKTKAAMAFYDQAIEADPAYTPAMFNKAILLEPTDLEAAVAIYQQILEIDPKASTTYLRLSFAYRTLGDTQKADEARASAIELDPSLADVTELSKG